MFSATTDIDNNAQKVIIETSISKNILETTYFNNQDYFLDEPLRTTSLVKIQSKLDDIQDVDKSKGSNILSSIKGVILDQSEEKVKIKLATGLVVFFPKELFPDEKLLQYGQQLIYRIEVNEKGYRYQKFVLDEKVEPNDKKTELIALIRSI